MEKIRLNEIISYCEGICEFLEREIPDTKMPFDKKDFIANLDYLRCLTIDNLEEN